MEQRLNVDEMKKYYQSQTEICFCCDLFSDKENHGSKIIMLFAEVFSFMVDVYGLSNASNIIIQYSNSTGFKKWFWRVKYSLGQHLKEDPSFYEIGKWIGKGFFLKICLSLIMYNGLILNEKILNRIIERQKKIIHELGNDENFGRMNLKMEKSEKHYTLFNEKINLSYTESCFFLENIIL